MPDTVVPSEVEGCCGYDFENKLYIVKEIISMKLQLISLDQPVYEYEISWLELDTTTGNYVIQPGHAPMILILTPDSKVTCCLVRNGEQKLFIIRDGIVHIKRDGIILSYNS